MPELPDLPRLPEGLLRDLRAEPSYALETLALAAVDVHGPAAAKWVAAKAAAQYSPEQLAKVAVKRHANLARIEGAALGIGGALTIAPDAVALVWILTREALFVSAAYGKDPLQEERAAEMLVVLEVYPDVQQARAGLKRQGERLAIALARQQVGNRIGTGKQRRSVGNRLARYAGRRVATRYGGRLVPGLGALLGAIDNAAAARRYGDRAIAFYRGR